MNKIYRYELRRLLGGKIFWCLLAVLVWYSWQTLTGETIRGVANTAPFSPWSFGSYLATVLPFLCLGELFFLTVFTSAKERGTAAVTAATPVDPGRYALVRCGAVLTGTLLLVLAVVGLGLWFYARYFRWTDFATLLAPGLLALLPALTFALGAGWCLGRLRPALVYALAAVLFLLPALPLPEALDPIGSGFFTQYPAALGILDPAFSVPAPALAGRLALLLAGLLLTALAVRSRTERT